MEIKVGNKISLLSYKLNPILETQNNEAIDSQSYLNRNSSNQLLTPQLLRAKKSSLLSGANSDPETEWDFRRTVLSYKSNFNWNSELKNAYKEYLEAYHQAKSLYLTMKVKKWTGLIIFDSESETEDMKVLNTPEPLSNGTCVAQLPNAELFCFGNDLLSGITMIIDKNLKARKLPSGMPCHWSSAIYFKRNVYCFGGLYKSFTLALSFRYDLDENRWVELLSMPEPDDRCNSIIFNGNIWISGYISMHIWLYSIDLDSFSKIDCVFGNNVRKNLIATNGRMYLISVYFNVLIYESKDGYAWELVYDKLISQKPVQINCLYNKGGIYIRCSNKYEGNYHFKFHLQENVLSQIFCEDSDSECEWNINTNLHLRF